MIGAYSPGKIKTPGVKSYNKDALWKQLGYSSEQAYLNSMGGGVEPLSVYTSTEPIGQRVSFMNEPKLQNYSATYTSNGSVGNGDVGGEKKSGSSSKEYWSNFYDDQRNSLLSLYGGAQKKLDDEKKNSQQMASIAYDKLKRYLPTQIKAQGLGGLGVSESTMLEAENNYANQMADISSAYSSKTADLEAQKTSALGELENYRVAKLDGLQTEEWNTAYDNAGAAIDNSGIYDQEKMNEFVEQFRGKVSDSQFNALVSRGQSVVATNKQGRDDVAQEDTSLYSAKAYIDRIQGGKYMGTREELYEACLQNRNAGYMTDEEVKQVMYEYDMRYAYGEGKISTETYYDSINGEEYAINKVNNALNKEAFKTEAKKKAMDYGFETAGNVVDVTSDTFDILEFGKYLGSGEANSDQNVYLNKIIDDAISGKIKEGMVVCANAGTRGGGYHWYVFLGNGTFVQIKNENNFKQNVINAVKMYIPNGYHMDWFGQIYPDK